MEYDQETFLNWAAGSSREERGEFLRRYLNILPTQELTNVNGLVKSAVKRRQRKLGVVVKRTRLSDDSVAVSADPVASLVKILPDSQATITCKSLTGWMKGLNFKKFLAFDVEKVEIKNPYPGKPKYYQKAAEVTVVDENLNVVYKERIKRAPNSFRVNPNAKNGFTSNSLKDGKEIEQVLHDLRELFEGSLLVGVAVAGDMDSLDLTMTDFTVIDLQWEWFTEATNRDGRQVIEPLGLRTLCHHFFKVDMQPSNKIHTSENDAHWTMKLFTDIYLKKDPTYKYNPSPSNEIIRLK